MDSGPAVDHAPAAAEQQKPASTASGQAPPGFKLVKVQNADGSISTVKRKITPDSGPAAPPTTTTGVPSTPVEAPQFKIVTVRKPDGTLVKVRRPINKSSKDAENKPEPNVKGSASPKATSVAIMSEPTAVKSPEGIKGASTGTTTAARDIENPKSGVGTTAAASDAEHSKPVAGTAAAASGAEKLKPGAGVPSPSLDEQGLAKALAEQESYHRETRTHRLKSSLMRGLGMAVGAALPGLEISDDFLDGDELLSDDDDDFSIDDDDKGGHDDDIDDGHDLSDELHARGNVEDAEAGDIGNSASGALPSFDVGVAAGGIATAMAANAARQPPPPAQNGVKAPPNGDTSKADPEKEKHTYKITVQELADIEKAGAEKLTEKPLRRHWANVTFYLMASLSLILPSLFLVLAGFIFGMKGQLVGSNWTELEDIIKVAISAWPIVFAAVVAQCFKAWATFKVERGIKLIELEQLVGSNSFASAVKQPILLRRVDLLTLVLFAVWCLSPIGSQALQRVYTLDRPQIETNSSVQMARNYGPSRMFTNTSGKSTEYGNGKQYSELLSLVSTYYISALASDGIEEKYGLDHYLHPVVTLPSRGHVQEYGTFLRYPQSNLTWDGDINADLTKAAKGIKKFEKLTFSLPYSYFQFTCNPWQIKPRHEVENTLIHGSISQTLFVDMIPISETDENLRAIGFASAVQVQYVDVNRSAEYDPSDAKWLTDPTYPYAYIECNFTQVFMESQVECVTDPEVNTGHWLPYCEYIDITELDVLPPEEVERRNMTTIVDNFAGDFVVSGNPASYSAGATLTELYLAQGSKLHGYLSANLKNGLNLTRDVLPEQFADRFGFLFNTWMALGYCPECVDQVYYDATGYGEDELREMNAQYVDIPAKVVSADRLVYAISAPWLAVFAICAIILFVGGLIGVVVESMTVAPDVLGYVSTVARNSRYLHLPKTSTTMSGGERAKTVGGVKVMMQDVKGAANVGKIALGLKHEKAKRLVPGRLYR